MIGGVYSEGHCDCSAFALEVGWHRRTPIPVRRVVQGDTFVGSVFDLVEANRLRPTWHSSDLQKSKEESEPPPQLIDGSLRSVQSQRS